jgi:hypothetical protein
MTAGAPTDQARAYVSLVAVEQLIAWRSPQLGNHRAINSLSCANVGYYPSGSGRAVTPIDRGLPPVLVRIWCGSRATAPEGAGPAGRLEHDPLMRGHIGADVAAASPEGTVIVISIRLKSDRFMIAVCEDPFDLCDAASRAHDLPLQVP